jgi:peptidoglycan hydrolase FlgJ
MIGNSPSASVYTDFKGLAELRVAAGKQTPEATRETARQFEALFVQNMLKSMREASGGDGLFDNEQSDFYREIYDRQLALEMVKGRGLGIADMLVKSLGGAPAAESATAPPLQQNLARSSLPPVPRAASASSAPLVNMSAVPALISQRQVPAPLVSIGPPAEPEAPADEAAAQDWSPDSPEQFVRQLLPYAARGAAELGVQPGVLVAQAALETGWGQKVIRHPDGSNSFNLFGIKADSGWSGARVQVPTLEYEGGVAVKKRAAFRSYASLDEAVSGYVDFVRSNPRYRQALAQAGNTDAYLDGLQSAGYATDPRYADKIRAIMQRSGMEQEPEQLVMSDNTPLF